MISSTDNARFLFAIVGIAMLAIFVRGLVRQILKTSCKIMNRYESHGRGEAFGSVTELTLLRSRMLRPYANVRAVITQEVLNE